MVAAEKIKKALEPFRHPVARILYNGKASTYFTFQHIAGVPKGFADDNNEATETTWRVNLFSKSDYTALLAKVIAALKAAGFYGVTVEAEGYEMETGFYHVPMQIKYLEE